MEVMATTDDHRPSPDPPILLDIQAVLRHVPVSRSVLDRWISEGFFPRADICRGTKIRLWRRETIVAWAHRRANEPSVN
jgi:predicted DNA-binding transcriptional regulator AlpA